MDTRNKDYPPDVLWDNCEHQWQEIESQFEGAVKCLKCGCPGVMESDGGVYWPTT